LERKRRGELNIKTIKSIFLSFMLVFVLAQLCTASNWGIGARALGMGGAYTAIADDGTAAYWNPAGITQVNMGLLLNGGVQGDWQMVDAVKEQDPAALDGKFGFNAAAGLTFERLALNFWTGLQAEEVVGNSEKTMGINRSKQGVLTLATEFTELVALGVNAKYLYLEEENFTLDGSTGKDNGQGFALDLGGLFKVGKLVRVGAVLKDYPLTKMEINGDAYEFPTKVVLGGAVKIPLLGMVVAADVESSLRSEGQTVFHVGIEQPILGILFVRAGGYQSAEGFSWTAGGGLKLGPVLVDVAADLGDESSFYATAGIKF
jgi:hypothetical protein